MLAGLVSKKAGQARNTNRIEIGRGCGPFLLCNQIHIFVSGLKKEKFSQRRNVNKYKIVVHKL